MGNTSVTNQYRKFLCINTIHWAQTINFYRLFIHCAKSLDVPYVGRTSDSDLDFKLPAISMLEIYFQAWSMCVNSVGDFHFS